MNQTRFESLGSFLPEGEETLSELLSRMSFVPPFDYGKITGIKSRRISNKSKEAIESSFAMAYLAAKDCLSRSRYAAEALDVVISTSITRSKDGIEQYFTPSFALMLAKKLGAKKAIHFDISNACAGMSTGVLALDRLIRSGAATNGLVVSGECISLAADTAAKEISQPFDEQFASLSVGDAASALIMDRAVDAADIIEYVELTTCAEYAHLCIGKPSDQNASIALYTDNQNLHKKDRLLLWPAFQKHLLKQRGSSFGEEAYDHVIFHQVSETLFRKGAALGEAMFQAKMPPGIEVLSYLGNTASTAHFVALQEYLKQGKIKKGSKILIVPAASGVVTGCLSATITSLEGLV